jgi:pilus assembly protein Flp/PilA
MLSTLKSMIRDEEGATMVEYGLLIALIAMVALAAVTLLGHNLSSLFNTVAGTI